MADADASNSAVWLSSPNHVVVELARDIGYRRFILDIEHGLFELETTDRLVVLIKAMGLEVYAKVLGPEAVPIQQALDMGCDGVLIPQINDVRHAKAVTAAAKYPPLGNRGFTARRTSGYGNLPENYHHRENVRTRCFPMIESAAALRDVKSILALPTVDGIFLGPTDLSLSRSRGAYRRTEADIADLRLVAEASLTARKPWIMPAWTPEERSLSAELGAEFMVVVDEIGAVKQGLSNVWASLAQSERRL